MNQKFVSIFLVSSFLALVRTEIGFTDCGSHFRIQRIIISGCYTNPCYIPRGSVQQVSVLFQNVPVLDTMDTKAFIFMYGNRFPLTVQVKEPCIVSCPLREEMVSATYDLDVYFPTNLMSRPGELVINTTYVSRGRVSVALCVDIDVDILRL